MFCRGRCQRNFQGFRAFGRAGKKFVRKLAVNKHVLINALSELQIQAQSGQVLQAQVPVAVDLGVLQPRRQIARLTGERADEVKRGIEAGVLERVATRLGILRAARAVV